MSQNIKSTTRQLKFFQVKPRPTQLRGFLRNIYSIQKRATFPAIQSGMRLTYRCTEWHRKNSITCAK